MLSAFSVSSTCPSLHTIILTSFSQSRLGFTAPIKPLTEPSSSSTSAKQIQIPEINYDNTPPSFPLPNSIQRASTSTSIIEAPTFSFDSPPVSDNEEEEEEDEEQEGVKGELEAPTTSLKKIVLQKRKKVFVEQGYSQLHWAKLKSSGADLRVSIIKIIVYFISVLSLILLFLIILSWIK